MDKDKLRGTYSAARKNMSRTDVLQKSQQIADLFLARFAYFPRHILSYQPITKENEIDPSYIEQLYPEVVITKVPTGRYSTVKSGAFDMILVPMIIGDYECHRLGFGGGWYDRFLSSQPNAKKIGLCYEDCIVSALPSERHDIALDYIVTEKRVITRRVE